MSGPTTLRAGWLAPGVEANGLVEGTEMPPDLKESFVAGPDTPTGDAEVDAGLRRLADADHLATDGHVEVYEDVHRGLRDALTALDARPGPPAPPSPYDRRS